MSSRALRRLQQEEIIKVGASASSEEENNQPGFSTAVRSKKKTASVNPFAALQGEEEEHESDRDGDAEEEGSCSQDSKPRPKPSTAAAKKKKKRKKSRPQMKEVDTEQEGGGVEEVDAAVKEVNEMLGVAAYGIKKLNLGPSVTGVLKPLFIVEKRFLNAENEMKRIFGSRVVRAEAGRQRAHRRVHLRHTLFATPKDTWPKMDKTGLSMEMAEMKDGFQYFVFRHSPDYQKVQSQFLEAVETFDPNAIGAVLHAHPYHIDSLLQLSEVCKISEDMQMATELLERALYCFESNFHTLFNVAHGNCRLNYSISENRPFFIALFRHLYYVGRKGCHRTAFEFCKLLLGLEPEGDPLCVLLMIDYYALRADESAYFLELSKRWEVKKNLSQLPNFAFSVPLALFNIKQNPQSVKPWSDSGRADDKNDLSKGVGQADTQLQDALIMFPSVLLPLMEKCQVTLDPIIMKHPYFNNCRDPKPLELLIKLFVERNHSLWKIPEVLTWLEENARRVVARVDAKDRLVADCATKRQRRYVGTPRNIHRHIVMSDFDEVTATLPRELSESGIMMYDPLPPHDSTSGYTPPPRPQLPEGAGENPLLLFLRSMLPTFENLAAGEPMAAGGLPVPARQRFAAQQMQRRRAEAAAAGGAAAGGGGGAVGGAVGGAEGGGGAQREGGLEGLQIQPLDVQASLNELMEMLQRVLDFIPGRILGDSDGYESSSSSRGGDS